ncbi:hypothetical protein [uncultured Acetatifactor sp.]|uniref:hypothetical protein n=1 Tax=uncultured Acetatifactor sp. TaxID=1671927 RepID=UPI0026242510|nr:hypothetical protein [uncultured Acetatifactor sp.]
MSVNGIGYNYYQSNVAADRHNKSRVGQFYPQKQETEVSAPEDTRQNANVQDIYKALKSKNPLLEQEEDVSDEESKQEDKQESESKTEIIVKPDGSRVLVMTMSIGGMETTMSLEISKPTEAPNENSEHDANNTPTAENDTVSNEMSNVSSEA